MYLVQTLLRSCKNIGTNLKSVDGVCTLSPGDEGGLPAELFLIFDVLTLGSFPKYLWDEISDLFILKMVLVKGTEQVED